VAAGVGGLPGAAAARRVTRRPHRARGGAPPARRWAIGPPTGA
jgi:hypothetical protein